MTRHDLLIDTAIALVVLVVSIGLLFAGDSSPEGPAVALTAVSALPLVARRRAPLPVFVAAALASSAVRFFGVPAGPPLAPTVALFGLATATREGRVSFRLGAGVALAMVAAHVAASGLAEDRFPAAEILFATVLWGGVWLAGERAQLRQDRLRELEERAARAEREAERERRLVAAEERMRIARDLHDSAGHAMNVILVHAGLGRMRTEHDPAGARETLATIEEVARDTVGEIDRLVGALREEGGARDDVEPPPGLAALRSLVERHCAAGMEVALSAGAEAGALPPAVDQAAYRILQEALTNAARHGSGSARVEVTRARDELGLAVTNPIGGPAASRNGAGHGIVGMRERAGLLGGTLKVGAHGDQFRLEAKLPLTERPA